MINDKYRKISMAIAFALMLYPLVLFVSTPIFLPDLSYQSQRYRYASELLAITNSVVFVLLLGLDRSKLPRIYTWFFYLAAVSIGIWVLHGCYRIISGL